MKNHLTTEAGKTAPCRSLPRSSDKPGAALAGHEQHGKTVIMGEYAKYKGEEIKIGTCEDMYYLRADQARKVLPLRGNVDPVKDADGIRFRFPFPDEDSIEPGAFNDFNRTIGVWGVEVPEEIDHSSLQFTRNYPSSGGILLSAPCPESKEGKASGLRYHYNGYNGKVQIAQQRLVDGQLVLICQCGSCGAAYRCPTIEDAQPIIDALLKEADSDDHQDRLSAQHHGCEPSTSRGDFRREIARRIVAGYCEPNAWSKPALAAA